MPSTTGHALYRDPSVVSPNRRSREFICKITSYGSEKWLSVYGFRVGLNKSP